jgi:hypothetical protein
MFVRAVSGMNPDKELICGNPTDASVFQKRRKKKTYPNKSVKEDVVMVNKK